MYTLLQEYWWFLVSLLGALFVFLMFVQGGQSLLWQIGKTETERRMLLLATGRKWELTFTTLVTFGGAFFASFPLFYSTSFGGAYWVWILILLCFVIQAISYEFQLKRANLLGTGTYRAFLLANGTLGPILVGTAVGTLFFGAEFIVNKGNVTSPSMPVISSWASPWHGLEAVLDLRNILLGLAIFFLTRTLALLYFMNSIGEDSLILRCRKAVPLQAGLFLLFFLSFLGCLAVADGYIATSQGTIEIQPYRFCHTLAALPWAALILMAGIALVLFGICQGIKGNIRAIWPAGAGTVLTVLALLLTAGLNNNAYYPSLTDPASSLTLANSCSSEFTLRTMAAVSMLIPFVIAYIAWAWGALNRQPIAPSETKETTH